MKNVRTITGLVLLIAALALVATTTGIVCAKLLLKNLKEPQKAQAAVDLANPNSQLACR